jgi:hypothetical protein
VFSRRSAKSIYSPFIILLIINTISKWTDDFIVYISIYSSAHPSKYQGLLKYMHTALRGNKGSGTGMENI